LKRWSPGTARTRCSIEEARFEDFLSGADGTTLTKEEVDGVLARKALVLREVEAMIAESGESRVLY
jgi:hypothetical protein